MELYRYLSKKRHFQQIPVYRGCAEQLLYKPERSDYFHGMDGFGDLPSSQSEGSCSCVKEEPSPTGMYNIAKEFKNDIYLVTLAPLTNVAIAMKLYPDFADCFKEIYMMGGNHKG